MALGGGSLMAGIAGLILPGVPSGSFLLFSAHYFLRSSTTFGAGSIDARVADIVRKLEASEIFLDQVTLVKTLVMGILLGLMFLVIHPPLPLIMAIELGLAVFYGLREIGDLGPFCRLIPRSWHEP